MSQEHKSAGIDLDSLTRYDSFETDEGDELRVDQDGRWVRFDDLRELLARRAEPSVAADDVRTLAADLLRYLDEHDWGGIPEGATTDRLRAALASPAVADDRPVAEFADDFIFCLRKQPNGEPWPKGTKLYVRPSPAVSQKDGAAVECSDTACIRCVTGEGWCRNEPDNPYAALSWDQDEDPAATTTSACKVCNGTRCVYGVIGDPPEECEACADQQPAEATTTSQKDGEADCTEPNREACPRLCRDFCNAAEEARAATTASASSDEARTVIANLASVVRAQNGNRHADINELLARAEKCLAPALSLDTDTGTTGTAVRNTLFPGPSIGDVLASKDREISDLRAALAQQGASQAPQNCKKCGDTGEMDSGGAMPWGAPAMVRCECQEPEYLADQLEQIYAYPGEASPLRDCTEWKALRAALARAPLPAQGGWEDAAKWLMNHYQDYVNISELCKAMVAAAPAQAGDVRDAAVKLTRDDMGMCTVSLEVNGQWVDVIKDNGDIISHIVEPIGVKAAIERATAAASALTCKTCGADRSKDRCKAEHWQRCPMMGAAMSASQGQKGGAA